MKIDVFVLLCSTQFIFDAAPACGINLNSISKSDTARAGFTGKLIRVIVDSAKLQAGSYPLHSRMQGHA
jgi:hypothetical protein